MKMITAAQAREKSYHSEVFKTLEAKSEIKIIEATQVGANECVIDGLRALAPCALDYNSWGYFVKRFFEAQGFIADFSASRNDIIVLRW